jgi:hypothetical protein
MRGANIYKSNNKSRVLAANSPAWKQKLPISPNILRKSVLANWPIFFRRFRLVAKGKTAAQQTQLLPAFSSP